MNRTSWKVPLFYRYLISYLLLLGLPILVIGFTVYAHIVTLMKQQSFEANQKMLIQIREIVDTKFREFMSIAHTLSRDPVFSSKPPTEIYDILLAKNRLDFTSGNNFIREMLFYPTGGKYLFSYESSYDLNMFQQIYRFDGELKENFESAVLGLRRPEVVHAVRDEGTGASSRELVYLVPIPLNSTNPKGMAIFAVDESSYHRLFESLMKYEDSNTFVMDQAGTVLASLQPIRAVDRVILERLKRSENEGTKTLQAEDELYHVSYAKSDSTGWTYVTIVPDRELMLPVNDIKNKSLLAAALVAAFGVLMIYAGMRFNYRPVKAIIEQAEHVQARLKRQEEASAPVLREHLLSALLKGHYKDRETFNAAGAELGLELKRAAYQVAILQFDSKALEESDDRKMKLFAEWRELFPDRSEVYMVDLIEDNKAVCLLSIDDDSDGTEQAWTDAHSRYAVRSQQSVTLGVGNSYAELGQLYKSFIEASTALHYAAVKGKNKVIFFREASSERMDGVWYPHDEMKRLTESIRRSDAAETKRIVGVLVHKIRDNSTTMFMATSLCFDVIQAIWKTMQETNGVKFQKNPFPDVMALTRLESFDELSQVVFDASALAAAEIEEIRSHCAEQELYRSIVEYVEAHAMDYSFSIQSMADSFNWSASHIRKVFKERSGMTISDYVNELRIIKAKRLLATTELSLQDIVGQIGYADVSSFIRKFKQHTQSTPGDFRKMTASRGG